MQAALDLASSIAPDVVGTIVPVTPVAGDYAMSLEMRFETFVTTELRLAATTTGALQLSLASDGTAHVCLGSRVHTSSQGQRHYERDPAKRQHSDSVSLRLVALAGQWTTAEGVATIVLDRSASSTCDPQGAVKRDEPFVTLRCTGVAANAIARAGTLVCEAGEHDDLGGLGMPFTKAARVVSSQPHAGPSGRNLVVATGGAHVEVLEERKNIPDIKITAARVDLVEASYRPKP